MLFRSRFLFRWQRIALEERDDRREGDLVELRRRVSYCFQNGALFARIDAVYHAPNLKKLTPEQQRLASLATKLGYAEKDSASFIAHCERANAEWVRASELDSPAPRGHFLRTMGQSDRDFVENANPNASIPQALALMNGELLTDKVLFSPYSPLIHAVDQADDKMDAVFLAIFARHPTIEERALWKTGDHQEVRGLIYALLNTKQFVFVQ